MGRANLPLAAILSAGFLAGCSDWVRWDTTTRNLQPNAAVFTNADVRGVYRTDPDEFEDGAVSPASIVCAEPSPDISRAVSTAFAADAALSGSKTSPTGDEVNVEAALALSRSRAEALTQLGERLATIQLLRDGLYRACEAFANGALSRTSYILILSRYDDVLISLLSSELAAGAFGRPLATAGSSSNANASLVTAADEKALETIGAIVESNRKIADLQDQISKELGKASPDGDEVTRLRGELASEETNRNTLQTQLSEALGERGLALAANADTMARASAPRAAGAITPKVDEDVAEVIHEIQKTYLHNVNSDALLSACIVSLEATSFERIENEEVPLARLINEHLIAQDAHFQARQRLAVATEELENFRAEENGDPPKADADAAEADQATNPPSRKDTLETQFQQATENVEQTRASLILSRRAIYQSLEMEDGPNALAMTCMESVIPAAMYSASTRIASFNDRSTDVDVINAHQGRSVDLINAQRGNTVDVINAEANRTCVQSLNLAMTMLSTCQQATREADAGEATGTNEAAVTNEPTGTSAVTSSGEATGENSSPPASGLSCTVAMEALRTARQCLATDSG